MKMHKLEVPSDDEEADKPVNFQNLELSVQVERKYTPHEALHLGDGENEDLPLQLLTADEKIEELQAILQHRDRIIEDLEIQIH